MGSCGVRDNDVIVITEFYSAKKEDVQGFDESCVGSQWEGCWTQIPDFSLSKGSLASSGSSQIYLGLPAI